MKHSYTITIDENRKTGNTSDFHVHRTGCQDVKKELKASRTCRSYETDGESAEVVVEEMIIYYDMGHTKDDFHICPCCKGKK